MMYKKDLYDWFWNKYNSCYQVKVELYPDSVFLVYDEKYIRKLKLFKLNNTEELISINNVEGTFLFNQDNKFRILWLSEELWKFFEKNYSYDYYDIQKLIKKLLKDHPILFDYNPLPGMIKNIYENSIIKSRL